MSAKVIPIRPEMRRIERSFLPAALEIMETPASPIVHVVGGIICLFLVTALAWSWFGHVDEIATAQGKLVPSGRTKLVQAFETGVVREIRVNDGDTVKAGQIVIVLDPTLPQADRTRSQEILTRAQLDEARLAALLGATGDPFAKIEAPPAMIAEARARLISDRAEEDSKLASQDRAIAGKRSERASIAAEINKIDAALPMAEERSKIREEALKSEFGSRMEYLNAAQQVVELQNERSVQVQKLASADSEIGALTAERARLAAQFLNDKQSDLAKASREAAEARSELDKATQRTDLTTITAPVDGVVQDLSVHTLGGVVQPGQQLLRVVPSDGVIEIESVVENKDVGFVRAGQPAEIKVEAFPFTRYGLLHGSVISVARDSGQDPEAQQQQGRQGSVAPGDAPTEARRSGGLVYIARISVPDPTLMVDGTRTALEPGMAVTAEIKTGRRRVLDFILSPIARQVHDAMRER